MEVISFEEEHRKKIIKKLHICDPSFTPSPEIQSLTTLPVSELQIALRKLKSTNAESKVLVKLIRAFHQNQFVDRNRFNALSDVLVSHAVRTAMIIEKSEKFESNSDLPLLGYVLAVHDHIEISCDISLTDQNVDQSLVSDSATFFSYLESKGAMVLSKSIVPRGLFSNQPNEGYCGSVKNPLSDDRSVGALNAGTASLILLGHVNAGIATDLGMSLILDAQFSGLTAINLTADRVSQSLFWSPNRNKESHLIARLDEDWKIGFGPMALQVDDLIPLAKAIIDYNQIDHKLVNKPWREYDTLPKRIGVLIEWDNLFPLSVCDKRACSIAIDVFRKRSCEVIHFDIRPYIHNLLVFCFALVIKGQSSSKSWQSFWTKDSLIPFEIESQNLSYFLPSSLQGVIQSFSNEIFARINSEALQVLKQHNVSYILAQIDFYRQTIFKEMKALGISVFICPGTLPLPTRQSLQNQPLLTAYSWLWSFLRFPCGTVPITRASIQEEHYIPTNRSSIERDLSQILAKSSGLPVSVEVVGLPWNDELVLQTMKELADETGLRKK